MTEPTPHPHKNIAQDDIPDRGLNEEGQFFYYEGTFEAAINAAKTGVGITPFRDIQIGGEYDWEDWSNNQDKEEWGDDQIELQHFHTKSTDGRIKLNVKAGWQVAMVMQTDNNDFFADYVEGDYVGYDGFGGDAQTTGGKLRLLENKPADTVAINDENQWTNSEAVFVLNGDTGDYLSVDIDSNNSTIAQMAVRLDGTQMFQNTNPNNEVTLRMIWARVWDGDYPSIQQIANELNADDFETDATPSISDNEELEENEEQGGSGDSGDSGDIGGSSGDETYVPLTPEHGLLYLLAGIVAVGLMVRYTRGA